MINKIEQECTCNYNNSAGSTTPVPCAGAVTAVYRYVGSRRNIITVQAVQRGCHVLVQSLQCTGMWGAGGIL